MSQDEERQAFAQVLVANDGEVISRLRLSAAEAARVCRVTPRQLIYWTRKGFVQASSDRDGSYDVFALERVIRIRQALERGHSLERAAAMVQRDISALSADVDRLAGLGPGELEEELRRRLERLEERIAGLRRELPAALSVARLRRAVALLERLGAEGRLPSASGDGTAKALTLRLGRAIDELEHILREVPASA